ncbi:MAG: CinA family nicotinamide mononucleotide deamidase-related protein [Bacteroidales bacterium]
MMKKTIRVEILNIGDELLNGTSVNTNATWLCGRCVQEGSNVLAVTMVGDSLEEILRALKRAASRSDLVVITGGLGPTSDDRTKDAALAFFGGQMVPVASEIERIRQLFAERGYPLTERNIQQGWIPDTTFNLGNPVGTAPGMEFIKDDTTFVFLPGVPAEMKAIFDQNFPRWFGREEISIRFIFSEMITVGIGESFVADTLSEWQNNLPGDLSLAFLPSAGLVKIRLSCFTDDTEATRLRINTLLSQAAERFPGDAFMTGGASWDEYFHRELLSTGKTIATAESCTGGYLAHRITSVPGSSAYYKGSIVAYHNDIKEAYLGVPGEMLEAHGAVSREVVTLMAQQIRIKLNTGIGVAISGVAGPDGGTQEKPVGTAWIAVADGAQSITKMFLMGSDRIRNIEKSTVMAMKMVLNLITSQ